MNFLRLLIHFFKTWFLPLPAHDDRIHLEESDDRNSAPEQSGDPAPLADEFSLDDDDDEEDGADEEDDPDYPEMTGAAPLNPVAPPEGADERASRTSARSVQSSPVE